VASDAFFPFADGMLPASKPAATAVIQPGGSVRDEEVIKAADEHASRWCLPACGISDIDSAPSLPGTTNRNQSRTLLSNTSPATKNSTSTAMPAF